jgi:hypothetical protein
MQLRDLYCRQKNLFLGNVVDYLERPVQYAQSVFHLVVQVFNHSCAANAAPFADVRKKVLVERDLLPAPFPIMETLYPLVDFILSIFLLRRSQMLTQMRLPEDRVPGARASPGDVSVGFVECVAGPPRNWFVI